MRKEEILTGDSLHASLLYQLIQDYTAGLLHQMEIATLRGYDPGTLVQRKIRSDLIVAATCVQAMGYEVERHHYLGNCETPGCQLNTDPIMLADNIAEMKTAMREIIELCVELDESAGVVVVNPPHGRMDMFGIILTDSRNTQN